MHRDTSSLSNDPQGTGTCKPEGKESTNGGAHARAGLVIARFFKQSLGGRSLEMNLKGVDTDDKKNKRQQHNRTNKERLIEAVRIGISRTRKSADRNQGVSYV